VSRLHFFTARQETHAAAERVAQRRFNRLAGARVLLFGAGVLLTYLSAGAGTGLAVAVAAGSFAGYLALMSRHQNVRVERDTARLLVELNRDEAARLGGTFRRPETGVAFLDPTHSYAADLDVFGPVSLFRLLNRTRTHGGTRRLADWLRVPASLPEIEQRQEAVRELASRTDWRQQLEATAMRERTGGESPEALLSWLQADDGILTNPVWRYLRWLPLLTGSLLVLGGLDLIASAWGWALFVGQVLALTKSGRATKHLLAQTEAAIGPLRAYAAMLEPLGAADYTSVRMRQIGETVAESARQIRHLARDLDRLSYRQNAYFHLFVGLVTGWDWQFGPRIMAWKQRHRAALPGWIDALSDYEALHSLAGLAFAEPDFVFPQVGTYAPILSAEALGHPLVPAARRVANDFQVSDWGHTALITGSNMSGKSTFLRTVGTNVVLALMGSVVAARAMRCPVVRVFTSMRTQDSLAESTSSFYAELQRLRQLLQLTAVPGEPPVLYFLDEILKGTNSADRHAGAQALIRQLHLAPAAGFVSTHDVELGEEAEGWSFVTNYHFRSTWSEGKLLFDYRLQEGVCRSFNASALMRQMGIKLPSF
jgi:hypothetical protein